MVLLVKTSSEDDLLGCESVFQQALNKHILVVEEEHVGGCGGSPLDVDILINATELRGGV